MIVVGCDFQNLSFGVVGALAVLALTGRHTRALSVSALLLKAFEKDSLHRGHPLHPPAHY